jgi:hypothetical protein
MSDPLQHGTASGEVSSLTLRDRASSHAGYATRVAERQRSAGSTGRRPTRELPPASRAADPATQALPRPGRDRVASPGRATDGGRRLEHAGLSLALLTRREERHDHPQGSSWRPSRAVRGAAAPGGMATSISIVPLARPTIRTGPRCSNRSIISRLLASIKAVKVRTPSSRARTDRLQQERAKAASLPFVDHGDGNLGRIGPLGAADVARDADALARLVEGEHRLMVAMVEVGQVTQRPLVELVHRSQEPAVARFGAQALEAPNEQIAVGAAALADAHARAVAQLDRLRALRPVVADKDRTHRSGSYSGICDPITTVRSSGRRK